MLAQYLYQNWDSWRSSGSATTTIRNRLIIIIFDADIRVVTQHSVRHTEGGARTEKLISTHIIRSLLRFAFEMISTCLLRKAESGKMMRRRYTHNTHTHTHTHTQTVPRGGRQLHPNAHECISARQCPATPFWPSAGGSSRDCSPECRPPAASCSGAGESQKHTALSRQNSESKLHKS
jgi:hypothetical protein